MTRDMSNGKPGKVLFAFAIPLLLGNIFQQLYNMVDSIVVGNYVGSNALAAVGTAFPVMMLLTAVMIGLTNGFSVVISQYFGAQKREEVRRSVYTATVFLFCISVAFSILGLLIPAAPHHDAHPGRYHDRCCHLPHDHLRRHDLFLYVQWILRHPPGIGG